MHPILESFNVQHQFDLWRLQHQHINVSQLKCNNSKDQQFRFILKDYISDGLRSINRIDTELW